MRNVGQRVGTYLLDEHVKVLWDLWGEAYESLCQSVTKQRHNIWHARIALQCIPSVASHSFEASRSHRLDESLSRHTVALQDTEDLVTCAKSCQPTPILPSLHVSHCTYQ